MSVRELTIVAMQSFFCCEPHRPVELDSILAQELSLPADSIICAGELTYLALERIHKLEVPSHKGINYA